MRKSLLYILLAAGLLAAVFTGATFPASAQQGTVASGDTQLSATTPTTDTLTTAQPPTVTTPTTPAPALPGTAPTPPAQTAPTAPPPATAPTPTATGPSATGGGTDTTTVPDLGEPPKLEGRRGHAQRRSGGPRLKPQPEVEPQAKPVDREPIRKPDGVPTPHNPTFFDALPGPAQVTGVPNFVISKFRVPPFLLPIYQAAGIEYGIRWEVLAAINEIETDYGRNLNVSTAGAVGWMQFLPSTWKVYGVDANHDGRRDPYNPVDAIFSAARYLAAAGGDKDLRQAIFAYNHADWYVDSVMLRARLIAGVPDAVVDSLTGLTEGRFPVYAHARYADDLAERQVARPSRRGRNAVRVIEGSPSRRGIDIYARKGAPVVAVNDGVVKKIGRSKRRGLYIVLQDVYGNRYTYSELRRVSRLYPVPKVGAGKPKNEASALPASRRLPKPVGPATAGRQVASSEAESRGERGARRNAAARRAAAPAPAPKIATKQRLFAHPSRPGARRHGGLEQIFNVRAAAAGFTSFRNYFSRALGLNAKNARLKRLRRGSHVVGGTILGRIGKTDPRRAPHVHFEIRPAGRGAPTIDPKPILDGWKLLEATAIYRASGRNALYSRSGDSLSIGQILLLPKPLLERRVLSDGRIDIYPAGREDIRTGQIDRRVLATLEYLAESGFDPTVTSLKSGHSYYTASGNVSEHSSGNAVDIAAVNGVPIAGHQEPGGLTEQVVRRLAMLQGTMRPHQIISLLDLGGNTLALPDHYNHIHVGFQPLFGENRKAGREALAVLKPGQWSNLVKRLGEIENPVVPTHPSKYALPARHRGGADRGAND